MTATDHLVLPPGTMIISATEYSDEVRSRLDCERDDFIISRPGSRSVSRVIDTASARLLAEFREPCTIVEAVIRYSNACGIDAREVLEVAYPMLLRLMNAGLLTPAAAAHNFSPSWREGNIVGNFVVRKPMQMASDTEVYEVSGSDHPQAVLKIARPGAPDNVSAALIREATILRHLDGQHNPALLAEGVHEGCAYLVISWCSGTSPVLAAQAQRASGSAPPPELLRLTSRILDAYAHIHQLGVIHGDVHPRNLLIDAEKVTIIDFGLAQLIAPDTSLAAPVRGGVGFYYEPEYARARLSGQTPPPVSASGEQYSVAALIYQLLTGSHYLDFQLDEEQAMQQIASAEPRWFAQCRVRPWPAGERVLRRALSKWAAARYPSLADFAAEFKAASSAPKRPSWPNHASARLLTSLLAELGSEGKLLTQGLTEGPTCSVMMGAAGVAYMFYRLAGQRGDAHLLSLADCWADRASRDRHTAAAWQSDDLQLGPAVTGPISLYHTATGLHCVAALISQARGDFPSLATNIRNFVSDSQQPCANLDLTMGRSSTLIGGALLLDALPGRADINREPLLSLGGTLIQDIWVQVAEYPPVSECRELVYLGMAHGWAGLIYAALRWCQAAQALPPQQVQTRLEQLAACALFVGQGLAWPIFSPIQSRQNSPMVGWCHGSAGYVHLWMLAHELYGDQIYLDLAEKAALHVWSADAPGNPNLCCGLSGAGYAMIKMYNITGEAIWLERARILAERAALNSRKTEFQRYSLYRGAVGTALLIADLEYPGSACMPVFERET